MYLYVFVFLFKVFLKFTNFFLQKDTAEVSRYKKTWFELGNLPSIQCSSVPFQDSSLSIGLTLLILVVNVQDRVVLTHMR